MRYELHNMDPQTFQQLCVSLAHSEVSTAIEPHGPGPDGGCDATLRGRFFWRPDQVEVSGHLVMQMKHKDVRTPKDAAWLCTKIKKELREWDSKRRRASRPDYMIFATNVSLSAVPGSGGIDTVRRTIERHFNESPLPPIRCDVWHYDQICTYLDNNRDVRTAYAGLTTTGDVLTDMQSRLDDAVPQLSRAPGTVDEQMRFHEGNTGRGSASKTKVVPVGDQLVAYFVRQRSPYDRGPQVLGRTGLSLFCNALAKVLVDEVEEEAGDETDSETQFVEKYGLYVVAKIVERGLTVAKLDPFKVFHVRDLQEPYEQALVVLRMFALQERLWNVNPDLELQAHISKSALEGFSLKSDPGLRLDIDHDGNGTVSWGSDDLGGIFRRGDAGLWVKE